jgi:cyclophilin family peptidyl-prolyl cis-trans isomerase
MGETMTVRLIICILTLTILYIQQYVVAWHVPTTSIPNRFKSKSSLFTKIRSELSTSDKSTFTTSSPKKLSNDSYKPEEYGNQRRMFLTATILSITASPSKVIGAVQQAVGSGEINCRAKNNCLEVGELDGAIGWGWGGKDRCDPTNPRCGTDGKLRDTDIIGQPIPTVPTIVSSPTTTNDAIPIRFTHIAAIQIEIGRDEIGILKIGLYGNEVPEAVQQLVNFLSESGFTATTISSSNIGQLQPAVTLQRGGIVTSIVPGKVIEFGVPIQSVAYAKSIGRSKVNENFVPQPRPKDALSETYKTIRNHDCAGLISIPEKGLGYGGTGFESDDECYESAFVITASSVPEFDNNKQQRRIVVGQILDKDSMAFLERLANIPTKRGIRGVIPGQTSGPPLPKVVVRQVQVSEISQQ